MKQYITPVWVLTAILVATSLAIENRVVKNPLGSAVVPPSGTRSGLIRSLNPLDTSGYSSNMIVTGNVAGGKQFRGTLPYNVFTNFSGATGSEAVDSFLQYSGGSEYHGNYSGRLTPYYSQTRTVTYSAPGVGVVAPQTTYRGYLQGEENLAVSQQTGQIKPSLPQVVAPGTQTGLSQMYMSGVRPMSMSLEDIEKLISSQTELSPRSKEQLEQLRQAQTKQFEEVLKQAGDRAAELEQKLNYKGGVQKQPEQGQTAAQPPAPEGTNVQSSGEHKTEEGASTSKFQQNILPQKPGDILSQKPQSVYEQMKMQISLLEKSRQSIIGRKPAAEQAAKETKEPEAEKSSSTGEKGEKAQDGAQATDELFKKLTPEEISIKAKTILGEYKTFTSFSQNKFNQYMIAGERYLKEGKFYLAADAYTLASLYKPNDPLAYAGRSHALFAAGEYVSSALYLSRALTIFPEYARFKIDIVTMIGDKDKLETRIADVQEWLKKNDVPELDFLLAYVYMQMGRLNDAKKSIDAASEKMSDVPAVQTLKDAIYGNTK